MTFQPEESFARSLDAADPLRHLRAQFHIPRTVGATSRAAPEVRLGSPDLPDPDGQPVVYFCGHSLGLQPRTARALVEQELEAWARLGVDAHFHSRNPWYSYHENLRDAGARLVGARPGEVVFMNSLTVNLHLLMMTFYRPTASRYRILIDAPAFPSDLYALQSQLRHHGFKPSEGLLSIEGGSEDIEAVLAERGSEIAVVLLSGVNFLTGQYFDLPRLADAAHRAGCVFGLDLAHAAGNVPLHLHDWRIDFAAWCGYKYLNAGPGARRRRVRA